MVRPVRPNAVMATKEGLWRFLSSSVNLLVIAPTTRIPPLAAVAQINLSAMR